MTSTRTGRRAGTATALVAAVGLTAACTGSLPPVQTVAQVDLTRYAGRWYQTAAYPQFFNQGLVGVTAAYTARPDGTIGVLNQGREGTCDGPASSVTGTATVVDRSTNAKLAVRFDQVPVTQLAPGTYWIIDLDSQGYRWAVVADDRRSSLFVLSRTPTLDPAVDGAIRERLRQQRFDLSKLVDTPPCPEP